jgi:4-amino-4-deoxy-L-arabinose transferase-like glycosyltransferase
MPERCELRRDPSARKPPLAILSVRGRSKHRRDEESTGPPPKQPFERSPRRVVERSLGVTRHDRVPFDSVHVRIFAARPGKATLAVVLAAALPRLVVLAVERGDILAAYTEKSDTFAQTFVKSGTFGFIAGHPSAYTQPLYAYFLIPLYWIFGRQWLVVGLAQIALAVATALVVREIGRRVAPRLAAPAAVVATLNPYLIWHDVHVNREIVDQLVLASLVLATLIAVERRSLGWATFAGALLGLSILGNSRLAALPLVVAAFLAWRLPRGRVAAAVLVLAASAAVVSPWLVRNRVQVGCFAITTDGRALWKANNVNTYGTLAAGMWIDDVPQPASFPPSAQTAAEEYTSTHKLIPVDECAQMRKFEHLTFVFWKKHPGEKAKLMGQAVELLWDPRSHETQGRSGSGTWRDTARRIGEPVYLVPLYVLALAGLYFAPFGFASLALLLLTYNTAAAMLFAGTTRYRVPFDFLLALLGSAVFERALSARRYRSAMPSAFWSAENDASAR